MNNMMLVLQKLNDIEKRLQVIEHKLGEQEKNNIKMDEHINFIDNIYDSVRKPFSNLLSVYSGKTVQIEKRNVLEDKLDP